MAKSAVHKLQKYRAKRNFEQTPEPLGRQALSAGKRLVIQLHFARRTHFDLRLEIDGVLVSWAVTRGPSANPRDKRLAVRTEDHPISYGSFEGLIPKPQYGGGTVILWESCNYRSLNGPASKGLIDGHIKFECDGKRMQGAWALVRMKSKEKSENWLLIKDRDAFAEADDSIASRFKTSVVSGLSRDELENVQPPNASKLIAKKKPSSNIPAPAFIAPQLCKVAEEPPAGDDWAFEMKYDGYRLIVGAAGQNVKIYTRSGQDWSDKFSSLVSAIQSLNLAPVVIDGEAVVFNSNGISDFPTLVTALQNSRSGSIVFVAFDLLIDNGEDIRKLPYLERKKHLKRLIPSSDERMRYGEHMESGGAAMFKSVTKAGGEGIIAKRKTAPYISGRSSNWIKIKGELREDALIIGYMPSDKHEGFASLLAAKQTNGKLTYVGRIGTGYNRGNRPLLDKLLVGTIQSPPKVINPELLPRGAIFIKSSFGAELQFGGWTSDQQMRQARFLGVQNDREMEMNSTPKAEKISSPTPSGKWRITHPDRLMFPKDKVSKGDIAEYYYNIKARILPHLKNRPISLLRVPNSIDEEVFFQRHPLKGITQGVRRFGDAKEPYFALVGEEGLAAAVQFGAIEFHGWNARLPNIDKPDRIIFDLDPDEKLPFADVKSAAHLLRDYLNAGGLQSWPLLSGGKGIHVLIPLNCTNTAVEIEGFCKQFAKRMEAENPKQFVANMSIAKRKGKIFIDYLRNRTKATAIVPWSLRARPGAPIAAPLSWEILQTAKSARDYTIHSFPEQEYWPDFLKSQQQLDKNILKLLQE
ncbi:MAG: DNA ligase D [Pseudomonadota bacterium]|nr:DNA ligase D [Pseudomonadota bacterium]